MSLYRYLGYGITGDDGVAKLEYDADGEQLAHSYTGVGAGKIDIIASTDSTISPSSLVSQPVEVIDGTFLDVADGSDYNDNGWTNTNLVTTLDRTDGTKIEQSNTSSVGSRYRTPSPNTDICIEFDFKIVNASDRVVTFRNGTSQVKVIYGSNVNAQADTWTHIKITLKDDKYYLNDSTSGTALSTWNRFYFESYSGNSMKYKNFVIYPI